MGGEGDQTRSLIGLARRWGVWVLGLLALVALSAQSADSGGIFASPPARAHYLPSQTATRYQDPSGKYTVVVRGPGPAIYF